MTTTAASSSLADRMLGALRLDDAAYEEIERDPGATGQAAFIVVASSVVAAIGNGLVSGRVLELGPIVAIAELVAWAAYAAVAFVVGAKLLPGKGTNADWGQLARTLGFANTPRFFLIFVGIAQVAALVRLVVAVWIVAATVVALRSALDIGTGRAVVVAILSALAQLVIIAVVVSVV